MRVGGSKRSLGADLRLGTIIVSHGVKMENGHVCRPTTLPSPANGFVQELEEVGTGTTQTG